MSSYRYYLVYKITNLINNKIYIGVHKTNNKNDSYMGSGKGIKTAIRKYGLSNFKKTIIRECSNSEEMFNLESELVTSKFVSKNYTYNQKIGGHGGFDHIDYTDPDMLEKWKASGRKSQKLTKEKIARKRSEDPEYNKLYLASMNKFAGKKHSQLTKEKIGKANSIKQKGSKNSQFGTCWIMNLSLKLNKKIPKSDLDSFINFGWIKGRKKFD